MANLYLVVDNIAGGEGWSMDNIEGIVNEPNQKRRQGTDHLNDQDMNDCDELYIKYIKVPEINITKPFYLLSGYYYFNYDGHVIDDSIEIYQPEDLDDNLSIQELHRKIRLKLNQLIIAGISKSHFTQLSKKTSIDILGNVRSKILHNLSHLYKQAKYKPKEDMLIDIVDADKYYKYDEYEKFDECVQVQIFKCLPTNGKFKCTMTHEAYREDHKDTLINIQGDGSHLHLNVNWEDKPIGDDVLLNLNDYIVQLELALIQNEKSINKLLGLRDRFDI
jgi:hypothetical protein